MFCPNCGTQNPDTATNCSKCGFNLKGAAAPKFKGTMLMMNAPPAAPRPGGAPAPGAAPVAPPPGAPGAPMAGGGPVGAVKPKLKGTMLGVAPPAAGGQAPEAAGPPMGAPAMGSPMGGAPAMGSPAPAMGSPGMPHDVNPLGGTMVADPAAMAAYSPQGAMGGSPPGMGAPPGPPPGMGAPPAPDPMGAPGPYGAPPGGQYGAPPGGQQYGAPPGGQQYGAPPGGQQYGAPPGGQPGFGGPPPGQPGFGGPPPGGQPGYGAPPGQPGFGGPQQGFGGYSPPAGSAPMAMAAPGAMAGGARGPVGKVRNPIMVLVLGMICFIYAIIAYWSMLNELKAFRGKDDINPIFLFIPILNIIMIWGLAPKVLEAKQMAGVPNAQVVHPILYLLLGMYFLPADLNEVFQAASGQPPR